MAAPGKSAQSDKTSQENSTQQTTSNANTNPYQNVNTNSQNTPTGPVVPNPYVYGVPNPYAYYGYNANYYQYNQQMPNQYAWPQIYPQQYYNYYNNFNVSMPVYPAVNHTSVKNPHQLIKTQQNTTISPMDSLNSQAIAKQNSSIIKPPFKCNVFNNSMNESSPKSILSIPKKSTDFSVKKTQTNNGSNIKSNEKPLESEDKYTALPPEMKGYVKRCFSSCRNSKQKDLMELHLREVIKNAINTKRLHLVNWDKRPLPKFGQEIACNMDEIGFSSDSPSSKSSANESSISKAKSKKSRKKTRNKEQNLNNNAKEKQKIPKVKEKFVVEMDEKDLRDRIHRRQNRFKNNIEMLTTTTQAPSSFVLDSKPVVGCSEAIEKPYLRLTSAPDPTSVRPQSVLEKSLSFIKKKYKKDRDYHYVCEQFKSIRQDLTIQGIRNDFVVKVYEKHARISLEENDLSEFNQCQNVLRDLYNDGFNGCQFEFLGYRFLYYIYTKSTLGFPKLVSYFLDRERIVALKILVKSYFPVVSIEKIVQNMGFNDEEEAIGWLYENIGITPDPNSNEKEDKIVFNCKNVNVMLTQKEVL